MRVTLNLGRFFHDHRSVAKIFINKNMKCIRDLQKHISKIFEIKKFYLKCEDCYLPAEEDINVLHSEDTLWAIPKIKKSLPISGDSGVETVVEDNQVSKAKNKKEKDEATVSSSNGDGNSVKQKKRKHDESDAVLNSNNLDLNIKTKKRKPTLENDSENSSKVDKNSKKNKKQIEKSDSGNASSTTYLSPDSSDPNKTVSSSDAIELSGGANPNVKVKSLINSFEKKKIDFKKQLPDYNFNENNKKINIVKTIVVSGIYKPSSSSASEHSNNDKETSSTKDQIQETSNADKKQEKSDDVFTFDDSNAATTESLESGYNSHVPRRRRNRIRKRKRVNKKCLDFIESSESVTKAIPIPLKEKSATARHVRFNDDGTVEENNFSLITQNGHISDSSSIEMITVKTEPLKTPVQTEPLNFTPVQTEPLNYTYQLLPTPLLNKVKVARPGRNPFRENVKNSDDSTVKNFPASSQNGQIVEELPKNPVKNEDTSLVTIEIEDHNSVDPISEEFISKQPTIHKNPRPGDVLAFKILKLSENYTPEVSSRIVGKVSRYDPETAEVSIDIISGQDQCVQPKGKFSLGDEEEVEPISDAVKYRSSWFDLLEPRILFP